MDLLTELATWLGDLEPAFAFLLALPIAVGAAGLAVEAYRSRRGDATPVDARDAGLPHHRTPARAP